MIVLTGAKAAVANNTLLLYLAVYRVGKKECGLLRIQRSIRSRYAFLPVRAPWGTGNSQGWRIR